MRLAIPRETQPGENRVSATAETVKKLVRLGADVVIESGAGTGAGISDADYEAAGASISSDRSALLGGADMVLRLRKPELDEISGLKAGCIHVSYLDPFNEKDLIKAFASQKRDGGEHGDDSSLDPQSKDGCAEFSSQPGRICGGDACGESHAAHHAHDDDPSRHIKAC